MLDTFLEVAYAHEKTASNKNRLAEVMTQLPDEELAKLASGEVKLGYFGCDDKWLEKYKGTPLMEQAIGLEQQSLEQEMQRKEQNQARQEMYREEDAQRDQISIQKKMLDLDLAKAESGMMSGGPEEGGPPGAPPMGGPPPPGPPPGLPPGPPPGAGPPPGGPPGIPPEAMKAAAVFAKAAMVLKEGRGPTLKSLASKALEAAKGAPKAIKETWTGERVKRTAEELRKAKRNVKSRGAKGAPKKYSGKATTQKGRKAQVTRHAEAGKSHKSEKWKQRGLKGGTAVAAVGTAGYAGKKALEGKTSTASVEERFIEAATKLAAGSYYAADQWGREMAIGDFSKVGLEKDAGAVRGLQAIYRGTVKAYKGKPMAGVFKKGRRKASKDMPEALKGGEGGAGEAFKAFKGLSKQYIKKYPKASVGIGVGVGAAGHKAASD